MPRRRAAAVEPEPEPEEEPEEEEEEEEALEEPLPLPEEEEGEEVAEEEEEEEEDDSEEEEDFAEEDEDEDAPRQKKGRGGAGPLKVMGEGEVLEAKEAETRYKSNLFRLQLVELLGEASVRDHAALTASVDARLALVARALHAWKRGAPSSAEVVGSVAARTAAAPPTVDVALTVPARWFRGCDLADAAAYAERRDAWARELHARLLRLAGAAEIAAVRGRVAVRLPKLQGAAYELLLLPAVAEGAVDEPCAAIAEDSLGPRIAAYVRERARSCRALPDAAVLLRVWMRRRWPSQQQQQCDDAVTPFHATLLLARLVERERGNRFLSSLQLLRLLFANAARLEATLAELPFFHSALTARLTPSALAEFAHEARVALAVLDNDTTPSGGFDELFLIPAPPVRRFDIIVRVCQRAAAAAGTVAISADAIADLLQRGIGTRCHLIRPLPSTSGSSGNNVCCSVGLVLNEETCRLVVERGPSAADLTAAAAFRELWGDKAEVRRFKDGSIVEATVWDSVPATQRHRVVEQMVVHLVRTHFGKGIIVHVANSQLDSALPEEIRHSAGTGAIGIVAAFDALAKRLRSLDLPLKIKTVSASSAALRYADVCYPTPNALGSRMPGDTFISPLRGVVRFESSSSWPDELEALRKVKAAMHVKVCNTLRDKHFIDAFPYDDHFEVIFKGFAFSFAVHNRREIVLLQKQSPQLADHLELELVHRPLHTSAIHALALKHQALSKTMRLAKRWVHSHMFSRHISEEAVELLVAHCFTSPAPGLVPQTHIAGFHRFLRFLASINTADLPELVIVDLHNDYTAKDNARIQASFEARRTREDFAPSLFISASYSQLHSVWTAHSPEPVILRRMVAFAGRSVELLEKLILGGGAGQHQWNMLFNTPLADYDFLIHLQPDKLPRLGQALPWHVSEASQAHSSRLASDARAIKRTSESSHRAKLTFAPPLVNFDPASLFYEELVRAFGSRALFFHNALGGDTIAGVWRPGVLGARPWQGPKDLSVIEPIGNKMVAFNVPEAFHDMELLGSGIVLSIETLNNAKP